MSRSLSGPHTFGSCLLTPTSRPKRSKSGLELKIRRAKGKSTLT